MHVQPYLFFDGRCDEAMAFYKQALGAEVQMRMQFNQNPQPMSSEGCGGESNAPPPPGEKVMHAQLRIGRTVIMMSDGRSTGTPKFDGFSLSLAVDSVADSERVFGALLEGGQTVMPLAPSFFSPKFGMLADRFGVHWMIMVDQKAEGTSSGGAAGTSNSGGSVKPFVITRTVNASRDVVWKAWSDREQLMQWFGPKGFTMTKANLDFRPGGTFHYCLKTPEGKPMWGRFSYREIEKPNRISLVNSFSDEQGGITRHPFSPTWPREMLSNTTFTEDGPSRTKITLEWSPLNATTDELSTFDSGRDSMKAGWTGTFEQLEAYLAKR